MDLKQLSEEIDYLKKRLANLEHKKLKLNEKFEVEVPDDIENYYFLDETGNVVYKALYSSNYQNKTFNLISEEIPITTK